MRYLFTILFCFFSGMLLAQDEDNMLDLLKNDSLKTKQLLATFKSTRIVILQSNETLYKRTLDVRISHRFGVIGSGSNSTSSYHNLWGFDEANDVRIAFEYGLTDKLTLGVSHSSYRENWEALGKYRILSQTPDHKLPFSLTAFGNIIFSSKEDPQLIYDEPSSSLEAQRRVSYTAQLIFSRKFSPKFSLALLPGIVHRNFTFEPYEENTSISMGIGGRLKLTHSMSLIMDYAYSFSDSHKPGNNNGFYNPLGAGLEFETGGHVFSIIFTNARSVLEKEFLTDTRDTWTKGGFRFSFTISRNFHF